MKLKLLLACMGMSATSPVAAAWQEATSQHFVVYSDDSPEKVAAFTSKLERFDKALRALRGIADDPISPMARVTVFVVSTVGAVQKLAGRGSGDIAGFYVPRASQSVAFVPRRSGSEDLSATEILLHEYSHHFMFSNWGGAVFPAWLVEGFAEFNAPATFKDDGGILLGGAPQYRAFGILDYETMPLKKLLTLDPNTLKDDSVRATFYARAWLLTHYLMLDAARRGQLSAYFAAINSGKSATEAAKLLGDPQKLDVELNKYAQQEHLSAFAIPGSRLGIRPVEVRALSLGEAAIMPARIASVRGVDGRTAPIVVALARKLAAPFPTDAAVQNELAEAEYDAGNWAASQAASDRALAADPKSIHALLYEGMARAAVAVAAKSTDPSQWATVRTWFSKANHLDPEYAWPLVLYYGSYVEAKQPPTPSAQKGLLYAHALAPFDQGLSISAAYVLLKQGKAGEAQAVLKPIAYNPHAGALAGSASAVIAAIDKGGADAALELLDKQSAGG